MAITENLYPSWIRGKKKFKNLHCMHIKCSKEQKNHLVSVVVLIHKVKYHVNDPIIQTLKHTFGMVTQAQARQRKKRD